MRRVIPVPVALPDDARCHADPCQGQDAEYDAPDESAAPPLEKLLPVLLSRCVRVDAYRALSLRIWVIEGGPGDLSAFEVPSEVFVCFVRVEL